VLCREYGSWLAGRGDRDEALRYLKRAIDLAPDDAKALRALARFEERRPAGGDDEAQDDK
jgi:tetratricopeptide (TPR) repeat protein